MICTGAFCKRREQCGRYYCNPQPNYRKLETLESLYYYGSGTISENGIEETWVCGEHGNWGMFEPLTER